MYGKTKTKTKKNELGKGMKEKPTQQKIYLSTIPDAVAVAYS